MSSTRASARPNPDAERTGAEIGTARGIFQRWVYIYYSPPQNTPVDQPGTGINEGDAPFNLETPEDRARLALLKGVVRLSRFKLTGSTLDLGSEQKIIDVPVDRGICCHVGGKIDFDGDGNLYLSTGDDTNPFESEGYSPIDERSNRNPAFDAQRTSANTNDLRGKILRIRTRPDSGGYTIPQGSLFRPGTARTKPEIYAMGFRNPFRFAVDRKSNAVYMGDYSPDADAPDPERGPQGIGRWMLVDRPGNYGWPYCMTREMGYVDYDFATGESGDEFPCPRPVNESSNNTGRRVLPEVVQPDVYYSYPDADLGLFPELLEDRGGDGIGPMGGAGVRRPAAQQLRDQVAESLRGAPAVLRVDVRLREGVRAQPPERQPPDRHPQPVPGRPQRDRPGQPDGHGVRPGRRALQAGVRRRSASASVRIIVGNQAPVVNLDTEPDPGQPFQFGQSVSFSVTVTDDDFVPERDCPRVTVAYILGHEQHGHPQSSTTGCSGTIQVPPADAGHEGENIAAVFVASYTDAPSGEEPQTGSDEVILRPNP